MRLPRSAFRRRLQVPAQVAASASLRPGEKVLAATVADDGTWLLGTRDALLVVPPVVEPSPVVEPVETRIPWEQVERADWDRDEERFVVTEVGEFGHPLRTHVHRVPDPGLLLELVRERVTASVVLQRRIALEGRRGLFVVARRAPAGGGPITWAYELDPGVDPDEPAVKSAAEAGLRAAQGEIGA